MSAALPLWRRIAASGANEGKFKALDVNKARRCTKFIGDGVAGSFTACYRDAAAELANTGDYAMGDWVMVSANGKRDDRYSPLDASGKLRGVYAIELALAAAAGATLVADTLPARSNGYNVGEEELAGVLQGELVFLEQPPESGVWVCPPDSRL